MYLTRLEVENFKRLAAVQLSLSPQGGLIEVCGENAQGKSSTLDSIWAALGGAKASPERPIRSGRQQASVSLQVGDLTVTRRWTTKGTTLVVTGRDGTKHTSPQTVLDKLYGSLGFDPLAFMQQDGRKQAETLRRLVGLDFTDLEQRRESLFAERTAVNSAVKSGEARLAAAPHHDGVGTDGVSLSRLTGQLRAGLEAKRSNDAERSKLTTYQTGVAAIEKEIADLEAKLTIARERLAKGRQMLSQQSTVVAALVDPDTNSLTCAIEDAETTNRKARENQEYNALATELRSNQEHAERLTAELDRIDSEKARRLASAAFPVPGLSLDGDTVTLNSLPLSQASMAERVKTCLAISAALKPELHVILIREGSFLDRNSLATVAAWAEAHGYQVFMERVQEHIDGQGVLIVDGRVAEASLADPTTMREPETALA